MSIYKPHMHGMVDSRLEEIDRQLRAGEPTKGWPGDSRLYLSVGFIIDRLTKQVVEHRAEVRRHNEDGSESFIGSWRPAEVPLIISDLARMRLDSPAHNDSLDNIVKHNLAKEKAAMQKWVDTQAALLDHTQFVYRKLISGEKPHTFISKKSKGLDTSKRITKKD